MTSKRDLERRIDALEEKAKVKEDEELPAWYENIPLELRDDDLAAWTYFITSGESRPDLEPPG